MCLHALMFVNLNESNQICSLILIFVYMCITSILNKTTLALVNAFRTRESLHNNVTNDTVSIIL